MEQPITTYEATYASPRRRRLLASKRLTTLLRTDARADRLGPVGVLLTACLLLTVCLPGVFLPATVSAAPRLGPVLECVRSNSDGSYTALFGYNNPTDSPIDIKMGGRNRFHPAPREREQPTHFLVGRHRAVLEVDFAGGNLLWILNGKTATASPNSTACPEPDVPLDFNGDGQSDLLWRNTSSGANALWLMDGTSTITTVALNQLTDTHWDVAAVHDFDGDGQPDIFWRHALSGANAVWLMNGTEFVSAVGLNTLTDTDWHMIGLADFDQDGAADIVWRHAVHGWNVVWFMDGVIFRSAESLPNVRDGNWQMIGLHDVNADDNPDLLWRHATSGANALWYMDGTSIAMGASLNQVSDTNWHIIGVSDFDGDNQNDILWRHATSGANVLWYMDQHTLLSAVSLNQVSDVDWQVAAVNDLNADDSPDLLWRHATQGYNALWYMDQQGSATTVSLNTLRDVSWKLAGTNVPSAQLSQPAIQAQPIPTPTTLQPAAQHALPGAPRTDLMQISAPGDVMLLEVTDQPLEQVMPVEPPADLMHIGAPGDMMAIDAPIEQAAPYHPNAQQQLYLPIVWR